jgi:hypothetical protein
VRDGVVESTGKALSAKPYSQVCSNDYTRHTIFCTNLVRKPTVIHRTKFFPNRGLCARETRVPHRFCADHFRNQDRALPAMCRVLIVEVDQIVPLGALIHSTKI